MKESNEVMNAKTKKTQPLFNLGDTFEFDGEQVKVVELLESGNVHLKKIDPPYSSFIVTEKEIAAGKEYATGGVIKKADYVVGECGRPEIDFTTSQPVSEDVKQLTKALDEAIDTFGKERLAKAVVEASKED